MEINAGLRSQIKQLKERIKKINPSKVKPGEAESLLKDLDALESRYEKERAKREEKAKAKAESKDVEKEAAPNPEIVDKVEKDPKVAPHVIKPSNEKIVEKVEKDPKVAPHIISDKESPLHKFSIDEMVEPSRGTPGSKGKVMRHDGPDDLVYVYWQEGPMKDKEEFGGYYPKDLRKCSDMCACGKMAKRQGSDNCSECRISELEKHSDLKDNYEALLADLKKEYAEELDRRHDTAWVRTLEQKITDLENKMKEKFGKEAESRECPKCSHAQFLHKGPQCDVPDCSCRKEKKATIFQCDNCKKPMSPTEQSHLENLPNGDQKWTCNKKQAAEIDHPSGTERLVVIDKTPEGDKAGIQPEGKDSRDEYQDQWAQPDGRDLESAKGVPGSLFTAETAENALTRLKSEIQAPFVNGQVSSLGGSDKISILLIISAYPKQWWSNGILENSAYGKFHINNDGEVEQFSGNFGPRGSNYSSFRKRNVKSIDQLIQVLNDFISKVPSEPTKQSSLKTASLKINVFDKTWNASPVIKNNGFLGYDISNENNKKIMFIKIAKKISQNQLQLIIEKELTKNYKQAKLIEDMGPLKKGARVFIVEEEFRNE